MADKASLDMLKDYYAKGAGSGSFQFLFPRYQARHPELDRSTRAGKQMWEHAHNDILELPIELGAAGILLLLLGGSYLGALFVRSYGWENPLTGCIVLGGVALIVYSWWDFPFQNPAILTTWCVSLVAAAMWTALEEMNMKA